MMGFEISGRNQIAMQCSMFCMVFYFVIGSIHAKIIPSTAIYAITCVQ